MAHTLPSVSVCGVTPLPLWGSRCYVREVWRFSSSLEVLMHRRRVSKRKSGRKFNKQVRRTKLANVVVAKRL